MAVVVSDTSPLRALAHLDLLELLPRLFGRVFVPPAVAGELSVTVPGVASVDLVRLAFVEIRAPLDVAAVARLATRLGAGEAEAIALALETQPTALLIDNLDGLDLASE